MSNTEALQMADELDRLDSQYDSEIAAELRRLAAENKLLNAELNQQARANGMGGEREARLMAVNAELTKALRHCMKVMQEEADAYLAWHSDTNATLLAEIAALKEYLNDKG